MGVFPDRLADRILPPAVAAVFGGTAAWRYQSESPFPG